MNDDKEQLFSDWWEEYRENSDISKNEAKEIWDTAFRLGGQKPWYSINKEQFKALYANFMKGQ